MMRGRPESALQLRMDFGRPLPESSPAAYPVKAGLFDELGPRDADLGRFVRRVQEGVSARTPAEVAAYFMQHIYTPWDDFTQEEFYTLMLDTKNRPTHAAMIYRGTLNAVYIRTAEVFRPAILHNAASIIMAHNHPSGDVALSPEDLRTSNQIAEAGRLLDIELLDSLIIGKDAYVSLKERDLLGV